MGTLRNWWLQTECKSSIFKIQNKNIVFKKAAYKWEKTKMSQLESC